MKTLIIIIAVALSSCCGRPAEYETIRTVVKAKTVDVSKGNTRYHIAFSNGMSKSITFGLYSRYEVGDTVCLIRGIKNSSLMRWELIDCPKKQNK